MLSSEWMRYCLILWTLDVHLCSRSPQGERGLKLRRRRDLGEVRGPLPARGAWIEITSACSTTSSEDVVPRRGRGLKCLRPVRTDERDGSFPAGGWIEICERRWLDDRHVTLSAWILTMASTSPFLAEF